MNLESSVLFTALVLACLLSYTSCQNSGDFRYPTECRGDSCTYEADWTWNNDTDIISFSVRARQNVDKWTGIAFGSTAAMIKLDLIYGFINSSGQAVIRDAWAEVQHTDTVDDSTTNIHNTSLSSVNGLLTLTFSRSRDTGDADQDLKFTDGNCYYFMYPVGGGPHSNDKNIEVHDSTPIISSNRICIPAGVNSLPLISRALLFSSLLITILVSTYL